MVNSMSSFVFSSLVLLAFSSWATSASTGRKTVASMNDIAHETGKSIAVSVPLEVAAKLDDDGEYDDDDDDDDIRARPPSDIPYETTTRSHDPPKPFVTSTSARELIRKFFSACQLHNSY